MKLKAWIESLYKPEETNLQFSSEDLLGMLNDAQVRRHWLNALVDELRAINVTADRVLDEGKSVEEFKSKSIRRRAIIFCLNQILDSKQSLDNEQFEDRKRDNLKIDFQAAPLDERRTTS